MDPFLLVYAVSASSSRVRRRIGLRCRDAFRLALVEGRKVSLQGGRIVEKLLQRLRLDLSGRSSSPTGRG